MLACMVFIVLAIVATIKKNGKAKRNWLFSGALFVVFIIFLAVTPPTDETNTNDTSSVPATSGVESATSNPQEPPKEPAEDEWQASYREIVMSETNRYIELVMEKTLTPEIYQSIVGVLNQHLEKIEGDDKESYAKLVALIERSDFEGAKELYLELGGEDIVVDTANTEVEEAKKNEVTIDGNGTFAVNAEVQPGIYRSEGNTYWARLAGFSGELEEILANGTPTGPTIVEIKASDVGFQTMGFGEWILIDESYAPEAQTEFGDGTYIVGKDIEPGTYKSNDSVVYWARLKDFSGDLESIHANGVPTGPEIVEISSSDVGFQTSGGGTWTKIK
jgi:hypothetical protein